MACLWLFCYAFDFDPAPHTHLDCRTPWSCHLADPQECQQAPESRRVELGRFQPGIQHNLCACPLLFTFFRHTVEPVTFLCQRVHTVTHLRKDLLRLGLGWSECQLFRSASCGTLKAFRRAMTAAHSDRLGSSDPTTIPGCIRAGATAAPAGSAEVKGAGRLRGALITAAWCISPHRPPLTLGFFSQC